MRPRAAGVSVVLGIALAMLGPAGALAGPGQALYLEGEDVPTASMTTSTPPSKPLPNFDPDRDDDPGLSLQKSDLGRLEIDHTKYQQWERDMSGQTVSVTDFVIWAAMKDFDEDKKGRFGVYVMDCELICIPLDSATGVVSGVETWKRIQVGLSIPDHYFGPGHDLIVKVVVLNGSEDDMWFAYATSSYPAHLMTSSSSAATTTTSTTSTTTSTTSTTSTTTPSTATTTAPTSTTTSPATTTTAPGATTTTAPDTTTTTTTVPDTTTTTPDTTTTAPGDTTTTTIPPESDEQDEEQTTAAPSIGSGAPPQRQLLVFSEGSSASHPGEVFAAGQRLDPQERLMVAFSTVAETINLHWQAAVALGSLAAILAWIGLSRRGEDKYWLSVEESVG